MYYHAFILTIFLLQGHALLQKSNLFHSQTSRVQGSLRPYPHFLVPQQLGSFEPLLVDETRRVRVAFYGLDKASSHQEPIAFEEAWAIQQDLQSAQFQKLVPGQRPEDYVYDKHSSIDTLLFVQHQPVYTLGTASDRAFILDDHPASADIPVIDINRGGEVTYHGPGQLVVYPILHLRNYRADLHWYMRALEEAVLYSLELAGIDSATRCEDTTGVWIDNHKIAAIGVSARRWITQHGVAINIEDRCIQAFNGIVPCGLEGRKVGCLNQFLKEPMTVQEFVPYMIQAMEYVFQMEVEMEE